MADGTISKEKRHQLKNEIEDLLSTISSEPNENMRIDNQLAGELRQESDYDFEGMSDGFTDKAREITDALFKNFVDVGIFENNDYARLKKEIDTINISNLFFQLKTLKIVIIKVMEEITSGNTHPRLIEVMGQLQDKMANITKMQSNYILFLEDTYKRLNNEAPANTDNVVIDSSKQEGKFFISVGTKNVIENLPEVEMDEEVITDDLVDPTNKMNLLNDSDIKFSVDDDNLEDTLDIDEII